VNENVIIKSFSFIVDVFEFWYVVVLVIVVL